MRNGKGISVKGTNKCVLCNMALVFVPFRSASFFLAFFSHLLMWKYALSRRNEHKKN